MTMNLTDSISRYNEWIKSHPNKVNKKIKVVYDKLLNDIKNGKKIDILDKETGQIETINYVFDAEKAKRPVEFLEKFCHHSKGKWSGQKVKLELWQKALIEAAYGFVDKETGLRKYRKVVLFVAKKNGKSFISSGLGLYGLTSDNEGGAEVYSVATTRDQAKIVWQEAKNMVGKSPALKKRCRRTISGIFYDKENSLFSPLASKTDSLDGKNPFYILEDETWAWTDPEMITIMEDGVSSREQPLIFETSTMGTVREKVFDNEYSYCERVIRGYLGEPGGVEDETILPIIYELDDEKEWINEESWYKANPNLGVSKKVAYLRNQVQKAINDPIKLTNLLCKDFNLRQTGTQSWLRFEEFNNEKECKDFNDCYCIGGVDLSSTTDLTCATLLGWQADEIKIKQMYWIPTNLLDRKITEDKIPYDKWLEKGWLRLSGDSKIDYHDVTQWFLEQAHEYDLRPLWVGYDSWNAQFWCDEMKNNGFNMVEVRQGAKTMSSPMKQMRADLIDKKINYNNNPILKWCLSNVSIQQDANENIRPVKEKSRQRIDGAVSLIDAYCIFIEHQQEYMNYVEDEEEEDVEGKEELIQ